MDGTFALLGKYSGRLQQKGEACLLIRFWPACEPPIIYPTDGSAQNIFCVAIFFAELFPGND
jgi:hypothetical protein